MSKRPALSIDMSNVSAKTKVSDLTVGQFTQLLKQVLAEIAAARNSPESVKAVFDQIRQITGDKNSKSLKTVNAAVRDAQNAILDQMPKIIAASQRSVSK